MSDDVAHEFNGLINNILNAIAYRGYLYNEIGSLIENNISFKCVLYVQTPKSFMIQEVSGLISNRINFCN